MATIGLIPLQIYLMPENGYGNGSGKISADNFINFLPHKYVGISAHTETGSHFEVAMRVRDFTYHLKAIGLWPLAFG
jgi:hypothetical protein